MVTSDNPNSSTALRGAFPRVEWAPTDGSVGSFKGGRIGLTMKHSGAVEGLSVMELQCLHHPGIESSPLGTVRSQSLRLILSDQK